MISTLTISGFRGISQEIPLKLGAVTLFAGRNGLGKTTVFDAIDWCLFGASWRLGFDTESIRNIYHPNLSPVVSMEMRLPDKTLLIERTAASAFLDGSRISDRDLVETLMTDPGGIAPYTRDVESRLRRVVYLSQEDIRALVHPDSGSERISLFQALLGVPNASVMQSGVRRIGEHFRQREQEMRLHLGQLHSRRDELRTALQDAASGTIDTARVVSEAAQSLNVLPSLTVEELAQRTRRELDKLSVEAIQLDEAVSAIAAFRERRKADAARAERLSQEIRRCSSEEAAVVSANEEASQHLASIRRANEERRKILDAALEQQRRLQDRLAAQRRIEELTVVEEEANRVHRASQEEAKRLRADLERFRSASDLALDRRRASAVKRSELDAARDRLRMLGDRQREGAELLGRAGQLTDAIDKCEREKASLRLRLEEAREELNRRRDQYDSLSKAASSSDALESLVRHAVSMFPQDLSDCPLCGTSFASRQELLQHVSRAREQYALTSAALSEALTTSRVQQELVGECERELHDVESALASIENEKSQCDTSLQRVRQVIASFTTQITAPTDEQLERLDAELRSIDDELTRLKNDIDDRTTRLGVAHDDVSRASSRLVSLQQQLVMARQTVEPTVPPAGLEGEVSSAVDAARAASVAAREAADAEKVAAENQRAKQTALDSVSRHVTDLHAQVVAERERRAAETSTLLRQLAGQVQGVPSLEEAAERVQKRRTETADRLLVLKRLWSELVAAATEERSKAILVQSDAVDHELAETQGSLDRLLHAHTRFTGIADELHKTAELEAADALQHQRQAIQECFAAMYPYGHLNKVVVGEEPLGKVLVTDDRLTGGVEPTTYLSTGQANVLALSIFMGIALRQRLLRIGVVCLDEPVQHLDDLHFLGFVSLLKRFGLSRQVVLSTADANVTEIITRQMHSSWAELPNDFIRYDWQSFDPETGPSVTIQRGPEQAVA
jgi:DNA repair exonuclease SbcCD ATPase subunit